MSQGNAEIAALREVTTTRVAPMWGLWVKGHLRPTLQLWGEDPRQALSWSSVWAPVAVGGPFQLREDERGLSVDDIARLHPCQEGA